MKAILFDTETTSNKSPEIIESSYIGIDIKNGEFDFGMPVTARYKPKEKITYGALASHHIFDEELEGCPPSSTFRLPEGISYIIGHKVDFDWEAYCVSTGKSFVAGDSMPDGIKLIDTLPIAQRIWPEAGSHTQSALMYFLFEEDYGRESIRNMLKDAHSAEADISFLSQILHKMCEKANIKSLEDLWELSEMCRMPEVMPMGKHAGTAIKDLPRDYKEWMINKGDFDPWLMKAVKASMAPVARNSPSA